jgi:hypothetical protein
LRSTPSVTSPRFSLYIRSNKIYYIGYYANGHRRWKSTGASTKSDALKALTDLRELIDEPGCILSFRQFVADFLPYFTIVHAGKTVAMFRGSLTGLLSTISKLMLRDITPEHTDHCKSKRMRDVKPVSVNIDLRMLRSVFSTARRWKLIEDNPCADVAFVAIPEESRPFLTMEDFLPGEECWKRICAALREIHPRVG